MPTGKTKVSTKYLDKYKEMNPNAVEGTDYYIEDKAKPTTTSSTGSSFTTTSDTKGSVDQEDITTIANEKPDAIAPPKKKSGGPVSYKDAYAAAGGAAKLGDYGAWEKKARDWNIKKYGTTEPTAKAKKFTGGSKTELAKEHTASQTLVKKIEPRPAVQISIETPANERLQQAVASANSSESLMSGTKTRREKRQQVRQENRKIFRQGLQADKQDRQDNRSRRQSNRQTRRQERQNVKETGSKHGRPTSMPELDTGPGTYQGAQKAEAEKKKNWRSSLSNKTFGM